MPQNRQYNFERPELQLPQQIPPPLFDIGTTVRWHSVKSDRVSQETILPPLAMQTDSPHYSTDGGLVLGMRYIWSKHLQSWQYQYYIALDLNSPSYRWTKFDRGWQEDLKLICEDEKDK